MEDEVWALAGGAGMTPSWHLASSTRGQGAEGRERLVLNLQLNIINQLCRLK
jgi:hypothetical protein